MSKEENEASAAYNLESEDFRVYLQHYDKRDKEKVERTKARSRSRPTQACIREKIILTLK